jgi:hypothetical protein
MGRDGGARLAGGLTSEGDRLIIKGKFQTEDELSAAMFTIRSDATAGSQAP